MDDRRAPASHASWPEKTDTYLGDELMDPTRTFATLSWITLPTVMYGGYAHAGMLLALSLP